MRDSKLGMLKVRENEVSLRERVWWYCAFANTEGAMHTPLDQLSHMGSFG